MSKRTNEQSKDMDGGDVDITPIKEPNTKKQKVITVQKMEDILSNNKETMTPTSSSSSSSTTTTITSETSPTPLPPKHVIAELLNIRLQLGVTDGSRIEVLWQSEQTEEDVWWPATVNIDMNKSQQSSDWSSNNLSDSQIKYASYDVIFLFELKLILEKMLKREGRTEIADSAFEFLPTRIKMDFLDWYDLDIFSH